MLTEHRAGKNKMVSS